MSKTTASCPDLERLEQFVESALPANAHELIQAHLAECGDCVLHVAEIRDNLRLAPRLVRNEADDTLATAKPGDRSTSAKSPPRAASPIARVDPLCSDQFPGYSDVSALSRGGQGVVYRATQDGTKRAVAIKVLLDGSEATEATVRRFEREIELAGQLSHPNIVPVFHTGRTSDGRLFFVMDYVDGRPLREYMRELDLPLESALDLFTAVCDAVQFAHQRGIIHRDLKPSNILVDAGGVPHILDFGLARQIGRPPEEDLTLTQQIMGTLPYMSPEQARGERHGVDTRTDVYALGVILYELLTGFYPYPVTGNMLDVIQHIVDTQPTPLSQQWQRSQSGVRRRASRRFRAGGCPIDHDVQTIVLRALAKEPERRYQSAGEFARDIEHFRHGRPIEAKRDSFWYVLAMLGRRNIPQAIVAASVLVIFGSAATATWQAYDWAGQEHAQRKESDERLAFETTDIPAHLRGVPLLLFSTVLAEWRADRPDAAAFVFKKLPPGSPERAAAQYVLRGDASESALLQSFPQEHIELAWFAIAEKRLESGNTDGAKQAFLNAMEAAAPEAGDTPLIYRFAESRIRQISDSSPS